MVRTVQVSHTHSPFSSLGTWLPGFRSAHEVGVHPAGGGCHFSCDPKGWGKSKAAHHASPVAGQKWEQVH